MKIRSIRVALSFLFLVSLFAAALPQVGFAQTATAVAPSGQYDKALAEIESKIDARRKELGIPGVSLAIVKDGQVIYAKGLGYKDFENKVAVTPDTQFAIGSATKAFTALTVLMSQDEGKLSIDDSPKKYLPYFKMYDPDTDANIKIRDLMCHSSGLNRTDLAMITGKLNRAELIQVAAQAKPTAKLREKFQYQNIMFTAAGEIVSKVQKEPWEKFVPERIFKPLGMTNSTMTLEAMQKAKDYSFGYAYNFDTKATNRLPYRSIDAVAPAGAINSSANDMAKWVNFVINGGTVNGKRLVSEAGYKEWISPQMKIAGTMSYGFGWFLQDWKGLKVVQHGGNIDGFNSMVAIIPEKKIGFVLLTNVSASTLGNDAMDIIWSNLIGTPATDENVKLPLKTMARMAGTYHLAEANIDIDVKIEGDALVMHVPGQPAYKLERTAPRTFNLGGAPAGYSVKFTPEVDDATELVLTQPDRVLTLKRVKTAAETAPPTNVPTEAAKDLIGKYTGQGGGIVDVKADGDKVTFNIEGQQPYSLVPRTAGGFSMPPLPDEYWLRTKRDADGKLISLVVTQPQGEFEFKARSGDEKPPIAVDELMAKMIDAVGGEANLRKLTSRVATFDVDLESQGVKAFGTSWAKAPNLSATETTFTALSKTIGTEYEYFDGTVGEDAVSFAPTDKLAGRRLADTRVSSDFYGALNWKTSYKSVEVIGMKIVDGENCYIVHYTSDKGTNATDFVSATSFLTLRHSGEIPSSVSSQSLPYTVDYSDYRDVDGIKLPFKQTTESVSNGTIVTTIKSVKHNVPIDNAVFGPKK